MVDKDILNWNWTTEWTTELILDAVTRPRRCQALDCLPCRLGGQLQSLSLEITWDQSANGIWFLENYLVLHTWLYFFILPKNFILWKYRQANAEPMGFRLDIDLHLYNGTGIMFCYSLVETSIEWWTNGPTYCIGLHYYTGNGAQIVSYKDLKDALILLRCMLLWMAIHFYLDNLLCTFA